MKEIDLVKTPEGLRGWRDEDEAAYQRFRKKMAELEVGECVRVGYTVPRNPKFHRKLFAMLTVGYDAWEPMAQRKRRTYKGVVIAKNFEAFREDVTILAGYSEQHFDLKGRMSLKAKSIAFANMEQEEFEKLYSAVADVLLDLLLTAKGYDRASLDEAVERIKELN
jgi:hypothetical protein